MKLFLLLTGLLIALSAGAATAQDVSLAVGFGAPRPYVSGWVFVGRPHPRPLYRPFFYERYPRPFFGGPRVMIVEPRRYHRWYRQRRGWRRWDRDWDDR